MLCRNTQKAVLKSRFNSLIPLAKTLNESEEAYYLEHGAYTSDIGALDVITNDTHAQVTMGKEISHQYVKLTREDIKNNLVMYQKHSPNFAGETHCEALIGNALANWLCKDSLKGTYISNKYGYSVYSLSEQFVGTLTRTYTFPAYQARVADEDHCLNCYQGKFSDGAWCIGNGCAYGTFTNNAVGKDAGWHGVYNHSYCIGDAAWSCSSSQFNNHSVCYANSPTACRFSYGGSYDETSCCMGTYCPKEEDTCEYKGITPPPQPTYQ